MFEGRLTNNYLKLKIFFKLSDKLDRADQGIFKIEKVKRGTVCIKEKIEIQLSDTPVAVGKITTMVND